MMYIENLLGEVEKKIKIQWRTSYPTEYEELTNISEDTQNVLSQIRRILLLEDPYQGSTEEQKSAYNDLERLTCDNTKDLFAYMNEFKILAAKLGRMYLSLELSEKFFRKMPSLIGKELERAFAEKYLGNTIGVIPRIHFAYQYLAEMCKKAAFQRSLKDLDFCSKIPIPGYYKTNKKYGLRKSRTYKGKPHESHVRAKGKKHPEKLKKCKCYICGEEGHFARERRKKHGNIAQAAIVDNLELPDDCDFVSVDPNDSDNDAICSVSEGEAGTTSQNAATILATLPYEETFFVLGEANCGWRKQIQLPRKQEECIHNWLRNTEIEFIYKRCSFCKEETTIRMWRHCIKCKVTSCPLCSKFYLNEEIKPAPLEGPTFRGKDDFIKELLNYITYLLAENQRLEKCLEDQLRATAQTLERKDNEKGILIESEEDDTPEQAIVFIEEAILKEAQQAREGYKPSKRVLNRLYNMEVTFDISGVEKFTIRAILGTGATVCCIDLNSIPAAATEPSPYTVKFNGVNSKQTAKTNLKGGMMSIGENRFRIPFTYCFPMKISGDGIQMHIGYNFIIAMYGGLRIEGNSITFYKVVTTIEPKTDIELKAATAIPELGMDEIEFLEIQEAVFYTTGIRNISFEGKFSKLIQRLQDQGFIGENPIKHWATNKVICKLDIKNLDITIEDRPLKHVMPAMKEQFERHVSALLKLGVIRPSKSRHRTMAMMVNSGTTIDPKTGKDVKGKERMVFNYRTLNDNTHKDQYSLPGINTILKKVGNNTIYSKFDLKSGFHQVLMEEESIPWTAFFVPGGLYE
ncbi:hypothetical protein OPV22_028738 [Ensete ventricosum]|uniref:CCHC-type domain-containing protein n=1 Tax=Ensete ventricosum TaxID=4639 RepID=A0AAV8P5D5_ENSVE|nr:hypothetical protein OPV22_028738 [Ensete ventricosum]